jgi:hypothetical protein
MIVAAFLLFSPDIVKGAIEKHEYDITAAGIRIGEMTATRERIENQTWYTLHSEVSFWFFVRVKVVYSVKSLYQNNQLIRSTVDTHSNRGDFKSTVTWNEDHYDVRVEGYKYTNEVRLKEPISYSSARIYFDYPYAVSSILADNYGIMVPVDKTEKDALTVTIQGNKNRFYFKSGRIIRAVMHHPIKNFEIRLKS